MADCVRLTYPGRARNCQAKTVTLAGWTVMVAAWTPEENNAPARSLVERTLDFWRSAALLSDRREDLQAALRASVSYGMGEARDAALKEAMLAVAVFANDAAYWGRTGAGNVWRYAVGDGWRRLTRGGAAWAEGTETGMDGLAIVPPGCGRLLKEQRHRLLRTQTVLDEAPGVTGPSICAAFTPRPEQGGQAARTDAGTGQKSTGSKMIDRRLCQCLNWISTRWWRMPGPWKPFRRRYPRTEAPR